MLYSNHEVQYGKDAQEITYKKFWKLFIYKNMKKGDLQKRKVIKWLTETIQPI